MNSDNNPGRMILEPYYRFPDAEAAKEEFDMMCARERIYDQALKRVWTISPMMTKLDVAQDAVIDLYLTWKKQPEKGLYAGQVYWAIKHSIGNKYARRMKKGDAIRQIEYPSMISDIAEDRGIGDDDFLLTDIDRNERWGMAEVDAKIDMDSVINRAIERIIDKHRRKNPRKRKLEEESIIRMLNAVVSAYKYADLNGKQKDSVAEHWKMMGINVPLAYVWRKQLFAEIRQILEG